MKQPFPLILRNGKTIESIDDWQSGEETSFCQTKSHVRA